MHPRKGCRILAMYDSYIMGGPRSIWTRTRTGGWPSRPWRPTKSDLIREAVDRLLDEPLSEEAELARFRAAVDATSRMLDVRGTA